MRYWVFQKLLQVLLILKTTGFTFTVFLAGHMIFSKCLVLLLGGFSDWLVPMSVKLLGYIFLN